MSNTKLIYGPYGYVIGNADKIAEYLKNVSTTIEEDNRKVTLLFGRESLLYDIANIAYVEADVMKEDAPHERHQVFDITEDGNVDRVTRILDLVHAQCVEALSAYTQCECEDDTSLNDDFTEADTYQIVMNVPQQFSATTAKYLEQLIHEYMVDMVLAEWLMITKPDSAANWATKAASLMEEIKKKLNARSGRVLRPLRPF